MKFKKIIQRGQVLALYGVLIPFLFLFVGVGLDLGWYYLNVSRLQNAADAAALAGAFELTEKDKTMRDYFVDGLTTEPSGVKDDKYYSSFNIDTGETDESGNSIINKVDLAKKNGLSVSELQQSKTEALSYVTQNLYDVTKEHAEISGTAKKTINEWTSDKDVTFSATLFTRILDADREKLSSTESTGFRYYKVQLTEKINHLFMPGWFEPMDAIVVAWAVIKPRDLDLVKNLNDLSLSQVIQNVIYQDNTKNNPEAGYKGKWAHFQDQGVYYTAGDVNRTEVVNIHNDLRTTNSNSDRTQNAYTGGGGNDNGADLDSLNLDFLVEYGFNKTFAGTDWDLRSALSEGTTRTTGSWARGWTVADKAADMRLITSFNFNYAWTDRNSNDLVPDILWTHIESDPLWFEYGGSWNSVHQIVLNAHVSNTAYETINGQKVYKQRPFVIFYDGPEVYTNSAVRVSQPVILNLYEDWNAILYLPNSPVIINGNGHKLTGFVVAKEYRRLKTAKDMEDEDYTTITDMYGKKLFTKQDLLTETQLNKIAEDKNYLKITDAKGNISFYEKVEATEHPTLSTTKAEANQYNSFTEYVNATYKAKFMAATGLSESEIDTVTFPTGKNLCDDEKYVVAKTDIKDEAPDNTKIKYVEILRHFVDNGEEKTETKYIPKTSLPYVKVRRNEIRAYVSVYDLQKTRKSDVYGLNTVDESLGKTGNVSGDELWQPTTDTYKSDKFIQKSLWDNTYSKEYIDSEIKFVESDGFNCFIIISKVPVVAEYRKVTDDEGNVFYVEEKEWTNGEAAYYMEVLPEGSYKTDENGDAVLDREGNYVESNPIIVDNWGDLQSVPITPSGILSIETETQNDDAEADSDLNAYYNTYTRATTESEDDIPGYPVKEQPGDPGRTTDSGKYVGTNGNRVKELYKVPALERVYYPSVKDKANNREIGFNLSSNSCYSYFQIEELKRVNYTYLNIDELNERVESSNPNEDEDAWKVDDMFFTTKRGKWID